MAQRQTPIASLENRYVLFSSGITWPNTPYLYQSTFNELSSVSQYIFLPGYLSSVWTGINLGSTMYVSTITNPNAMIVGSNNTVGGIYTLTAGWDNSNFGSNAFVGGCNSYGIGANIMAYGRGVQATSTNAAAFGIGSVAGGVNSVAHGTSTLTLIGSNQHAHGNLSVADGTASHAEGWSTLVFSDFSHVGGSDTQIWSGIASHAEGTDTWISSFGVSHVEGLSTFVYGGIGSHAEGANTVADIGLAHAEGEATISLGSTSHTQGLLNIVSTFTSTISNVMSNVTASNAHVEGMCNLVFMPNNHIEGISSFNVGWVNHVNGIGNFTQGILDHIEGYSNISEAQPAFNNSSFIKSFSSILTFGQYNQLNLTGIGWFANYQYFSAVNHIEGITNYISAPTTICHIEGASNSTCGMLTHVEGACNNIFFGFSTVGPGGLNLPPTRGLNATIGQGIHMEGLSNFMANPTTATHMEGISNVYAGQSRYSQSGHLEGIGNIIGSPIPGGTGLEEAKAQHAEGSNNALTFAYPVGKVGEPCHKEGINNSIGDGGGLVHMAGEMNRASGRGTIIGLSNGIGNNWYGVAIGVNNNFLGCNSFVIGGYNYNQNNAIANGILIGNYLNNTSNNSIFSQGQEAFFHSTPISKLIAGSAQSMMLNLISMTSTLALSYNNFRYYSTAPPNATFSLRSDSNIPFYTMISPCNILYPASNQITYINIADVKITGYQQRRADSSGSGLGFYSGDYYFAIYRDNTRTSNLCICDLVSLSTVSTSALRIISTVIKPIIETNRLFNTTEVNIQVWASNIQQILGSPANQRASYGLAVNTNNEIVTNWTAQCEISQVMRP